MNLRCQIEFSKTKIGESTLGAPIYLFPAKVECKLLVIAGIHGEEPDSVLVLSRALRLLKHQPKFTSILLCANPDGITSGERCNANGVDLNRNFPAKNWSPKPVFSRAYVTEEANMQYSSGTEPASEIETQIILEQIKQLKPEQILSIHSPLACIDDPNSSELALWLSKKSGLPLVQEIGYETPGSLGSFCAEQNIPLITLELPHQPLEQLMKSWSILLAEFIEKIENSS